MKKFALPVLVVVAFVVAIAFANSAFAGGQCCMSASTACKVSTDAAKTSATSATATISTARPVKATAKSSPAPKCATTAHCDGKVCGPCDPSDCKGGPCGDCDMSKCQRSYATPTSASKSAM